MSVSPVNLSGQQQYAAANRQNPAARPTDTAVDTFVRVPASMTMQDLRKIAQASLQASDTPKPIDPKKIPFGVELEMEHFDAEQAKPFIMSQDAWNVHPKYHTWKVVPDASLSSKTGGEAVSPPMTLENGVAEKQIRATLAEMQRLGGSMTRNCGLHIHVDASVLGEKGLANLMMIALENEHALFRYSQNGFPEHRGTLPGHGLRHNTPYHYCKPLGPKLGDAFDIKHAGSPNEFRNAIFGAIQPDAFYQSLIQRGEARPRPAVPAVNSSEPFHPDHKDSVRYYGINFNAYWYMGTIEFRLFEATADPDQVMENVNVVLGMVASAARGDYAYLRNNPLNTQANPPVSRETFDYLLSRIAPTKALQDRVRHTFTSSGGSFQNDAPVTDPGVMQSAFLMEGGYKFQADGKAIHSPLEVNDLVRAGQHRMSIVDTQGRVRNIKSPADLEAAAADLEGTTNRERIAGLSPADRDLFASANTLIDRGYQFSVPNQPSLRKGSLDLLNATALKPTELLVQNGNVSGRVADRAGLEQLIAVELGHTDHISPETRARLEMLDALAAKGYRLFGPDAQQEVKSRVATLLVPLETMYVQTPSGSGYKFRATPDVMAALNSFAAGRKDAMAENVAAGLDRATRMSERGFTFDGSAAHGGPDLIATLASGQPIGWSDPVGKKHQASGVADLVAQGDRQLASLQVPAEHQAAFDDLTQMMGEGQAVAWSSDATPNILDGNKVAWMLGNNINVNVQGADELKTAGGQPSQNWSLPVASWEGLSNFVRSENPGRDTHDSKLALIDGMRKLGAQFQFVSPSTASAKNAGAPISFNSTIINQFDNAGVQVRLPKTIFWSGFPRKTLTIRADETALSTAARRIGYRAPEAPAPAENVAPPTEASTAAPAETPAPPVPATTEAQTTAASAEQPATAADTGAAVPKKAKGFLGLW